MRRIFCFFSFILSVILLFATFSLAYAAQDRVQSMETQVTATVTLPRPELMEVVDRLDSGLFRVRVTAIPNSVIEVHRDGVLVSSLTSSSSDMVVNLSVPPGESSFDVRVVDGDGSQSDFNRLSLNRQLQAFTIRSDLGDVKVLNFDETPGEWETFKSDYERTQIAAVLGMSIQGLVLIGLILLTLFFVLFIFLPKKRH